ncbi:hypothetical protein ABT024_41315, partial [Streptomyces sp. NPDC002812]
EVHGDGGGVLVRGPGQVVGRSGGLGHQRGGADENGGSGLTGMRRRVAAHDGTLSLTSPPGGPTTLQVELPCGS